MTGLRISGTLGHDGDGWVALRISVANAMIAATTIVGTDMDDPVELAARLAGFPRNSADRVEFTIGSRGHGHCHLHFICTDGAGHTAVWASIEGSEMIGDPPLRESARIFMRHDAAAIDRFVDELRAFAVGRANVAVVGDKPG